MTLSWIVGLDGSDGSASALRWAAELARRRGERVVPVSTWHVPIPLRLLAGRRGLDVDRAGIEAETSVAAAAAVAALADASAVDEPRVVEGHPAPTLLDSAGPHTPLVVGRRGVSDLTHRVLGSVSNDLVTHSTGPVVVVPDGWETGPLERVVVGFDGSEHSVAALRWALSVAPVEAEIVAVVAIDVIPWLSPEQVVERHPDSVRDARARIAAAADRADPDGRAERSFVLHGPRQALAEAMDDADLVVVGPRGIGAVARTLLGSVTSWLLHDMRCPVAVVPSVD